jgi:predicted oxidoreductase
MALCEKKNQALQNACIHVKNAWINQEHNFYKMLPHVVHKQLTFNQITFSTLQQAIILLCIMEHVNC